MWATGGLALLLMAAGPAAAEEPARPAYLALGDSYSAGEGVEPYDPGTDVPENRCHRGGGYPRVLSGLETGAGYELVFVACGGARTNHVRSDEQRPGDQPGGQRSVLAARPGGGAGDIVSLTIGGNDARFGEVLRSCIVGLLPCSIRHADEGVHIEQTVRPLLADTYAELRAAAPAARIFVMTYPQIFQNGRECLGDAGISPWEKRWIRARTAQLNDVVVEEATRAGLIPVDVEDAFSGHEICTDDAWAFGLGRTSGRFHPNAAGHLAMAQALAAALTGAPPAQPEPPLLPPVVDPPSPDDQGRAVERAMTAWSEPR